MTPFAPGDRVVTINTDVTAPIYSTILKPACVLPDGPPRENTVYHVEGIKYTSDGNQGVFITGLRVFVDKYHIPWSSCRFCKWITSCVLMPASAAAKSQLAKAQKFESFVSPKTLVSICSATGESYTHIYDS